MAYRDMNGKVMIDEAAAQADIRQERQAEQILRRAANALQAGEVVGVGQLEPIPRK